MVIHLEGRFRRRTLSLSKEEEAGRVKKTCKKEEIGCGIEADNAITALESCIKHNGLIGRHRKTTEHRVV